MDINETILTIEDLRKSYGSKDVLNGISLQVKKRGNYRLYGANGAGKTDCENPAWH